MRKGRKPSFPRPAESPLDLRHLRRELRTALELAIVGLAPPSLVERLAAPTGLLEATAELPLDVPPLQALAPKVAGRSRRALADWHRWHAEHLAKVRA